jgi:very-long-chain (3R)-3-hydroxyacyl-CoA dehydratase
VLCAALRALRCLRLLLFPHRVCVVRIQHIAMGMKQMYLIAFNFSLAAGWAQILASIVRALLASCAPTDCRGLLPFGLATSQLCVCGDLHAQTQTALAIFQTAAVLEVLHSLFGVVRAPLFTTFIQVLSRLLLLWGIVVPFPATHTMPRFATMILAWSLTEVIRYSFYGFGLVLGKAPYPLVWLRYTLFFVLYPLGVGSEISLIYASLDDLAKVGMRGAFCFGIAAYLPGFPILYMHMISQRKKVLGGGRPKRKESGIVFPPGPKGDRSTTAAGKDAFAAAAAAVSDAAAAKVRKEKVWRYGYTKHVVQQVEMCSKSKGDCIKIADAGLKYLHENFEFIRDDKTTKFSEALTTIKGSFETGVMKGAEPMPKGCKLTVPYERGYSLLEPCTKTIEVSRFTLVAAHMACCRQRRHTPPPQAPRTVCAGLLLLL